MERLLLTAAGLTVFGAGLIGFCEESSGQALPQKMWSIPSPVLPLGYCSISVGSTTATAASLSCASSSILTPPGTLGQVYALVEAAGQVWFRDDGVTPSSTSGFPMASNTNQIFTENPLSSVQFIGSSTSTQINVLWYGVR